MTPGELLTSIIKRHNISQDEIAEAAGVSQMTVSRMRRDVQSVNFKLLKYLRKKYKVDMNLFFDENK